MRLEMVTQEADKLGRDWDHSDGPCWPELETARLVRGVSSYIGDTRKRLEITAALRAPAHWPFSYPL
jgi:hypothetical protein